MTDEQLFITEIIDRILKAEPDLIDDEGEYIERSRITKIIRGIGDE